MQPPSVQPLTLFIEAFWTSPYDCTCFVALQQKGLVFSTSTAMVRNGRSIIEAFRDQAVIGRVPALRHGDFWLSESVAIVEYLEDRFPPPGWPRLLPEDVRDRARVRQLMHWLRSGLDELRRARPSMSIFYPDALPPLSGEAARQAAELVDVAGRLLRPGAAWLFDTFSIADADLAFTLMRIVKNGDPVPEAIRVYAERAWEHPPVRAYVSHQRPPHAPR